MGMTQQNLTSRRRFLRLGAVATTAIGTGLIAGCQPNSPSTAAVNDGVKGEPNQPITKDSDKNENPKHAGGDANNAKNCFADTRYEFFGDHQAGITTPSQRHIYFLVMDLHTDKLEDVKQMFKDWTAFSANLTQGNNIKPYTNNEFVPPTDTGEADSLGAYGLTLTFGVSPSFFKKLGLTAKQPERAC